MFDTITSNAIIFWIAVIVIASIIEAASVQLLTIWFAVGAVAALVAGVFEASFQVQFLIFIIVSVVLLVLTRPIVKKFMKSNPKISSLNSSIGKIGKVVDEINAENSSGRVIVGDVNWNATSKDGSVIPVDSKVKVESEDGTTLIVSPVEIKEVQNV
jgi:membrane protein implicated in regulation of membrane protease activity